MTLLQVMDFPGSRGYRNHTLGYLGKPEHPMLGGCANRCSWSCMGLISPAAGSNPETAKHPVATEPQKTSTVSVAFFLIVPIRLAAKSFL